MQTGHENIFQHLGDDSNITSQQKRKKKEQKIEYYNYTRQNLHCYFLHDHPSFDLRHQTQTQFLALSSKCLQLVEQPMKS